MHVLCVVGARPNYMKVAPVHEALRRHGHRVRLVHTGQHYDASMSEVFVTHPRARDRLLAAGEPPPGLRLIPPLGYLDFLAVQADAALVLTDSGGLQEETTVLGVPCLTLRESTERPVTVEVGTNTVVGIDPQGIVRAAETVLDRGGKRGAVPPLWDGATGERVAEVFDAWRGPGA